MAPFASATWLPLSPALTVYVGTFGGSWQKAEEAAFFGPFTAKTGIKVVPVQGVSLAKVKAQIQARNYDFDVTDIEYHAAHLEGLVEPLDRNVVDVNNPAIKDGISGDGFKDVTGGSTLVYRKDKFPNGGPRSWTDFWDVKKFPGKRGMLVRANSVIEFALMADGVPPSKVYPFDMDRAFKKLDEIKPHITIWWTQGAQAMALMRDGEVDMMPMWSGGAQSLVDQGLPIEMVWNQAHLETGGKYYVLKGTPRAKNAFKYLEFFLDPKQHALFATMQNYGPGNPKAFDFMTKEQIAISPTAPDKLAQGIQPDYDWLTPRFGEIKDRLAAWMAG